ncbi:hypothetical protein GCM10029964_070440 [Kibdelosporangium lantanae]
MDPDESFVVINQSDPPDVAEDRTYAVVVDDAGHVVGLGTTAEVAEGTPLAPGVEIPADMPLEEVVASDAVTLLDLNPHGAVVVREGTVVGVVPAAVIDLAVTGATFAGNEMGSDSTLPGRIGVAAARVTCAWPGCGYLNVITFYDPDRPDLCANPALPDHAITLPGR